MYNLRMNKMKSLMALSMAAFITVGCGGNSAVKGDSSGADSVAVAPAADAPTLVVVKLKEQGVSEAEASLVSDMLRSSIARTGKYRVIEREQMERLMAEKAIAMADMTNDSAEAGVAKLLNARFMGVGSFGKLMGNYVLSFRVVDVETGLMKGAGTAEGETLDQVKKGIAKISASL